MQPKDVTPADIAFPAKVSHLMPSMSKIPADYPDRRKWIDFQQSWFYGTKGIESVTPKEGIDTQKALQHLACIQRSFEPKHEHKEAAVAYLASLWFDDVAYKAQPAKV